MNNYILSLFDTNILEKYEYISKDHFKEFVKHHVVSILRKIDINNSSYIEVDTESMSSIEKELYEKLKRCMKNVEMIKNNVLEQVQIDELIFELIGQKILIDSIDNIILLDEIDYITKENVSNKLKYAYYYLLEYEIYKFFNVQNVEWQDEEKKKYVENKVKYSSRTQEKIKQDIFKEIGNGSNDEYLRMKQIGILSTYPMRDIKEKYDTNVWLEIYKIKYLLTLDSKLKRCADNKVLNHNNSTMKQEYKNFFEEVLDKCKKQDGVQQQQINNLENEVKNLHQEISKKEKIISDYAESIEEYNKLSFFKKFIRLIKKSDIKLLKSGE